eukprot:m.18928 g.18928  ORF g.18928 m.18928 type:complete len:197 (-) comp10864_c0_seq1:86-676(-)
MPARRLRQAWDVFITIFVVGLSVLFVWRGSWTLFDRYLAPDDLAASAWYSLLLGVCIAVGAFLLQTFAPATFKDKSLLHSIALRCILLLYAIGSVAFWRGVWYLQDVYLIPSQPELSSWTSVAIGTVVLLCCNSFRSTLASPFFTASDGTDPLSWQLTTFYTEQERLESPQETGSQEDCIVHGVDKCSPELMMTSL